MSFSERLARAVRDPRKAAAALGGRLLSLVGHTDYRPFIVLTRSRSGSNLLIEAMNAHPQISAGGELMAQLQGRTPFAALSKAFGRQPASVKARGFKIFYYHPMDTGRDEVWNLLRSMEGLRVIHLKRRNTLHVLVSSRVAYNTGVYETRAWKKDEQSEQAMQTAGVVMFPREDLAEGFAKAERREREGAERFADHPMIDLYYEDMVEDLPREFRRITDFLGVDYAEPPTSSFRKQRTKGLRDVIANYDELKAGFAGGPWAHHFDE